MKKRIVEGWIPVKDSVSILAIVTAGLAKLVEEVKMSAAQIYIPTLKATIFFPSGRDSKMTMSNPKVAKISEIYILAPLLILEDISIIFNPKRKLANIVPKVAAKH